MSDDLQNEFDRLISDMANRDPLPGGTKASENLDDMVDDFLEDEAAELEASRDALKRQLDSIDNQLALIEATADVLAAEVAHCASEKICSLLGGDTHKDEFAAIIKGELLSSLKEDNDGQTDRV